jgi:hypothetical protein
LLDYEIMDLSGEVMVSCKGPGAGRTQLEGGGNWTRV